MSIKTLPEELVQKIKRIAHEVTRSAYDVKRDELVRRYS